MYALFAICTAICPSRLDDNISNTVKDRYSDQFSKMSRISVSSEEESLAAFEELFLYACPKFIPANPPPLLASSPNAVLPPLEEPAQRHLQVFLRSVRAQVPVPTLRSFLKLYASLDAKKLAGFLDVDEEDMVCQMMVMKQAGMSVSRVGAEKGLLEGQVVAVSDLNFVIDDVRWPSYYLHYAVLMW
jgi:translation initiation factor 3 subunit L